MNSKNIFPKILKQGLNDEVVYEIIYDEEQERDQLIMIIHYFDNFLNYLDTEMAIAHQRYKHKATQVSAGDFRHQYFWGNVDDPKYVQGIHILSYTPNPQKKLYGTPSETVLKTVNNVSSTKKLIQMAKNTAFPFNIS